MSQRNRGRGFVIALASGLLSAGAMEIPYDYHVPLTPETAILGYFSATKKPVAVVKSGAVVKIDGGGGSRWRDDPAAWLKENGIDATPESCPAIAETVKVLAETKN